MRFNLLIGAASVVLSMQLSPPASAGLIGSGNSVQVLFHFFDSLATPPAETVIGEPEVNPPTPTSLASPVTIPNQAIADTTIGFTDTHITLTNEGNLPFCSVTAASCPAVEFWAFEFQFSSGIDVTSVTLDPATAADFQPSGTGIRLLSSTDVQVEITNENPAPGNALILDVTTGGTPPPSVPGPASLALLGVGLAGMCAAGARARRARG